MSCPPFDDYKCSSFNIPFIKSIPLLPFLTRNTQIKSEMPSITQDSDFTLSDEQKAHFLEHGFVKIPQCFTRAQAAEFSSTMWTRLGMSPTDKSTWTAERVNMPWHKHVPVSEFSPKAWSAMCQLLGGEERISDSMRGWSDGFIVNLGLDEYKAEDEMKLRGKKVFSLRHIEFQFAL
jgi:hypothetical protein